MSEPAKDEAELMKAIALADEAELLRRIEEQTGWDGQWLMAAIATIAAIRAAGWAVVPVALLEEAASTLESLCDIEHIHRDKYPDEQRRYARDMEFPNSIRNLLAAAAGVKP